MKEKRVQRTSNDAHKSIELSLHESILNRTALLLERNNARKEETASFINQLRDRSKIPLISSISNNEPHGL